MQNSDEHELSFDDLSFDLTDFISGRAYNNTSSPKPSPLFPKPVIGKSRRSRASKKPATTLLTADANNFRALVQQFTGCHSGPPAYKGPINLNFEQYNSEKPHEARSIWSVNEELEQQSLVSFRADDVAINATTNISDGDKLFVSRPGPLTLDDFDMDDFSLQEIMSGAGGTITEDDDLWGYYSNN